MRAMWAAVRGGGVGGGGGGGGGYGGGRGVGGDSTGGDGSAANEGIGLRGVVIVGARVALRVALQNSLSVLTSPPQEPRTEDSRRRRGRWPAWRGGGDVSGALVAPLGLPAAASSFSFHTVFICWAVRVPVLAVAVPAHAVDGGVEGGGTHRRSCACPCRSVSCGFWSRPPRGFCCLPLQVVSIVRLDLLSMTRGAP